MSNVYFGDPTNDTFNMRGWECPKCGSVYSPSTPKCWCCGLNTNITVSKSTSTPVEITRSYTKEDIDKLRKLITKIAYEIDHCSAEEWFKKYKKKSTKRIVDEAFEKFKEGKL